MGTAPAVPLSAIHRLGFSPWGISLYRNVTPWDAYRSITLGTLKNTPSDSGALRKASS